MYVTRSLSQYIANPGAPPEGPNGGYLILQDAPLEPPIDPHYYLSKWLNNHPIGHLPLPQNKLHTITYYTDSTPTKRDPYPYADCTRYPVYFIPVINQPLSSNTYYAINWTSPGSYKGAAYASSTDEDVVPCCFFWNCRCDVKPRRLDPTDIYQQFKVSTVCRRWHGTVFSVKSAASDGYPPSFLDRRGGWSLDSEAPKNFKLGQALGLDRGLRARLPDFDQVPLHHRESKPVVVGKWYCPFMFARDVITPAEQVDKSMFYEMTLEQRWERFFLCENQGNNTVVVDVTVPTESVRVAGTDAVRLRADEDDAVVWFRSADGRKTAGLSSLVVRRMMWEEERAGWVRNKEKQDKVSISEEFGGDGKWTRYGCYMLVETFVLRRMDATVVLTYSFNHTHQLRSKWE